MKQTPEQIAALNRLRERIRALASMPVPSIDTEQRDEPPRSPLPGLRQQPPANLSLDELLDERHPATRRRRGRR